VQFKRCISPSAFNVESLRDEVLKKERKAPVRYLSVFDDRVCL
jgi:hypothetical protein